MKIRSHSDTYIVELDDDSTWRVFPGDLDVILNWQPDADLRLICIKDEVSPHVLKADHSRVRVIPADEN